MMRCRRSVAWAVAAVIALLAGPTAEAEDLTLADPSGNAVHWLEWIEANGPAAVLIWASWTPGADAAIDSLPDLTEAARAHGLKLVVVDVQEGADLAAPVLGRTAVPWLHDRHGAILKSYRLTRVPILIVVDRAGEVLGTLDPTLEALRGWAPP